MSEKPGSYPAILGLGFRPFYLLAACFAIVGMLAWLLSVYGVATAGSYLEGQEWHAHEMLFGFGAAVLAGFLLTAVRNWTGVATPVGPPLAAMAGLWLLGRVLLLTGPTGVAALLDAAFLPVLFYAIAVPILRSRNRRNYKVLAIVAVLASSNIVYHLSLDGSVSALLVPAAVATAANMFLLLLAIVGGRTIPAFTANAVDDATPRHDKSVEFISFAALLAVIAMDAAAPWIELPRSMFVTLAGIASVSHAIRLLLWQPQKTAANPLLWMMPLAYLWIPLTLLLRALAEAQLIAPVAATHSLMVGAASCMMLAMMMRSALGHTGRTLKASGLDIAAYLFLQAAAVTRVTATLVSPELYVMLVALSGAAWLAAFTLFLIRYLPVLVRPRIDGKPG